ncbi:MAG: HAMP domain-containing protein, partial [Candidatus Thiodiazotropha sp. (ex Cardiolucina cf. quadrata)]|nr:HAMP domain-containing protein [Candidatus Thiodiazotropha sp. (ex Cardiolucina cf. quadrata)]
DAPMQLLRENEGIVISEGELNGEMVFDFQAPLVFQNKNIGKIQLGLSQTPLIAAADLTFYTMLGLLVAVVLTVAIVAYLLATGMTVPMKILRRAITHVQHGNYGYRIKKERNDELGLLFVEYNRMAEALLNEKEEAQQMDQAIPLSIEPNEDKTNQAPLQDNKQITALDEESLPPLEEDIDDATRIMQPKVGK